MSYAKLLDSGKFLDLSVFNDGSSEEIWELDGEVYKCIWLPQNQSNLPTTIERF